MGMQPILNAIMPVKKIKGAARQRNVVTVGVDEPLKRGNILSYRTYPTAVASQVARFRLWLES